MAAPIAKPPLAEAKNGVVSPLYFDRQIIRAEDLTLDRTSHDRELARMRRLLHGWGVVAGLIPTIIGKNLSISAGYGVTRTGDEVYLTQALAIPAIAGRVWGCCATDELTCEVIDLAERERIAAEQEKSEVTSWLIARPLSSETEPRAGIADGCAHPANTPMPTRACDLVSIELLCELPSGFAGPPPVCSDLMQYFCGQPPAMLPLPPIPTPDQNILVLGRITAGVEDARFEPLDRRAVMPAALLQDWLSSCVCPVFEQRPAPPPSPEPNPGPNVPVDPEIPFPVDPEIPFPIDPEIPFPGDPIGPPIDPRDPLGPLDPRDPLGPRNPLDPRVPSGPGTGPIGPRVDPIDPSVTPVGPDIVPAGPGFGAGIVEDSNRGAIGWAEFGGLLEGNGFAPGAGDAVPSGIGGTSAPTARPASPSVMASSAEMRALEGAGINGPEAFLAAETGALAAVLKRPNEEVEAMASELESFRPFFAGTGL